MKTFTADKPVFVCLAHLLLILSLSRGSSLREHGLRGSGPDSGRENSGRPTPNADMLKALQYIQSLHQRTGAQQRPSLPARFDVQRLDDAEKLRAALRLASSPESKDEDGGEEEEGKSEELLQAVLSTLQQTEKAAKPPSLRPGLEGPQQKQRGIRPHEKLPLMFEDEEDEEEGKDEAPHQEEESPFKRTNEDVEEKYTPQNLATLQSVFDELDKLTGPRGPHKRHGEEDEEEDADGLGARDAAYDSAEGEAAEWGPLAEEEEEEEEEEEGEGEGEGEASRGPDYINDDEDEEEDEGESFPVKRSEDPEDAADMVDYYLLKVLEETQEEQKREQEEEELERAERRAAQTPYRDGVDPRAVYRLVQISRKYQIPPENLLDLLKMADRNELGKSGKSSRAQNRLFQILSRRPQKVPQAEPSNRRLHGRPKSPEEQRTEEVLALLGLGGGDRKEPRYQSARPPPAARPAGRRGAPAPARQRRPGADSEDGLDEDELAAYLAAQMLAQHPRPGRRNNSAGQKPGRGQRRADPLERAAQGYFRQVDSEQEDERPEQPGFDSGEALKLLSFLNPENPENPESRAEPGADEGV